MHEKCPKCGEVLFTYDSGITLHVLTQEPDCAAPAPDETARESGT